MLTQKLLNDLTYKIIGYAIEVHKELGPGLLESIYKSCMAHILIQNGHTVKRQQIVPVIFRGITLESELRFDLLVDDLVIVELKSVDALAPIFDAKLLTYMRFMEKSKGILINFNCVNIFKEGQKTLVNDLYARLPKE
ncbi:MAG: GxxExxY protein [Lentimicrobium sp.]|nr:GxxExxY protein [Lentimicrobium sp.]